MAASSVALAKEGKLRARFMECVIWNMEKNGLSSYYYQLFCKIVLLQLAIGWAGKPIITEPAQARALFRAV